MSRFLASGMQGAKKLGRKPQVTDQELVDAVRSELDEADDSTLAVSAMAISKRVCIGRQGTRRRLHRLAENESSEVRRFRASQAWLYYLNE